jgi:hypothetical protein
VGQPKNRAEVESSRLTSAPLGAEDARRFLQARIALFAKVSGLISLFFLVMGNVIALTLVPAATMHRALTALPNQMHVTAVAVTLGLWLVAVRVRLSREVLLWLDMAIVVVPMIAYAAMALAGFTDPRERMDMLLLLIGLVILTTRATVVPSTPKATALVSTFGMVPVVTVGFLTPSRFPNVPVCSRRRSRPTSSTVCARKPPKRGASASTSLVRRSAKAGWVRCTEPDTS